MRCAVLGGVYNEKKKSILIGMMLTIAIGLSACAQEERKDTIESVSEATESVEEVENNRAEVTETEPESEELTRVVEYVTPDIDLSFLGEAIKDLYIVSNDESKLKTRQEVIDYYHEKGYTFYSDFGFGLDDPKTYEEVSESKWGIYIQPEDVLEYADDDRYSGVALSFCDWTGVGDRLECMQYTISKCSAETVAAAREYFNNALASGIFEDCGCEVEIKNNGDDATWTQMTIRVKGDPVLSTQYCDYFFEIQIYLDEYKTHIFLNTY